MRILFFAATFLLPTAAFAQAGAAEAQVLTGLITGNLGTLLGLSIAFLGAWGFFMKKQSWGLVMMIGGAVITAFPTMFSGAYNNSEGVLQGLAPGISREVADF